jgi:chromosome segregation ATPase
MTKNSKELQTQFASTSRELMGLKRQMQEMNAAKIVEMRQEMERLRAEVRDRDEENVRLRREVEDSREKLSAKDRHIGRIEQETQQLRGHLEEKLRLIQVKESKAKEELESQRRHMLEKHQKLEEAQLQLASATDTVQLLQSAVVEKENELNAVKA